MYTIANNSRTFTVDHSGIVKVFDRSSGVEIQFSDTIRLNPEDTKTLVWLQELGAGIAVDPHETAEPVFSIDLSWTDCDDAHVARLPHSFAAWKLWELNLRGTRVTDCGLRHLSRMTCLRSLNLGHNRDAITDAGIEYLQDLYALEELELSLCEITYKGIASLASLKALRTLHMAHIPQIGCGLAYLGCLPNLEELNVECSAAERVKDLSWLRKLKALYLTDADVDLGNAWDDLREGTSLQVLDLQGNPFVHFEVLKGLTEMQLLAVGDDLALSISTDDQETLGNLTKLRFLRLVNYETFLAHGWSFLRRLLNLEVLELLGWERDGDDYGTGRSLADHLKDLRKLRVVSICDVPMTDADVDLVKSLPNIQAVRVGPSVRHHYFPAYPLQCPSRPSGLVLTMLEHDRPPKKIAHVE